MTPGDRRHPRQGCKSRRVHSGKWGITWVDGCDPGNFCGTMAREEQGGRTGLTGATAALLSVVSIFFIPYMTSIIPNPVIKSRFNLT